MKPLHFHPALLLLLAATLRADSVDVLLVADDAELQPLVQKLRSPRVPTRGLDLLGRHARR